MTQDDGCEGGRLARMVESADWPSASGASSGWACPTCARLAEVVLPYLLTLELRLAALERRRVLGTRGEGHAVEVPCQDCGRPFVRRSVLRKRCDACRVIWKRALNRRKVTT